MELTTKKDYEECVNRIEAWFAGEMSPDHTFLWIATNSEEEEYDIMKRVEKWSRTYKK